MTMTTMFVAMITPMTVSKVCDSTHSAMAILAGPRTYRANSAPGTAPDHVAVLIQPGLRLARLVAQRVLLLGASSQKLSGATYTASKGPSKTTSHRRVTPNKEHPKGLRDSIVESVRFRCAFSFTLCWFFAMVAFS